MNEFYSLLQSKVYLVQFTVEQILLDLVEAVKIVLQKGISESMYERSEVIDVPRISHQGNVEAVENIPQERMSFRRCEQSDVNDVTKIASQGPSLLRMVEQIVDDVTEISDADQRWQRTVKQFLDDTRHEPISRISASTRELRKDFIFV